MAPGVVDRLESVDVEVAHGQLFPGSCRRGQRHLHAVGQQHPVGQSRERVVVRHLPQLRFLRLDLRDVAEDADVANRGSFIVLHRDDGKLLGKYLVVLVAVPDFSAPLPGGLDFRPHGGIEGGVMAAGGKQTRCLSQGLCAAVAGDPAKGGVDLDDALLRVGDDDAVERVFGHAGGEGKAVERAPLLRLVAEHQHRTGDPAVAVADRRRRIGDGALRAVAGDQQGTVGQRHHRAFAQATSDRTIHIVAAGLADDLEDFQHGMPHCRIRFPAGERFRQRVHECHPAFRIGREHAVADRGKRHGKPFGLLAQGLLCRLQRRRHAVEGGNDVGEFRAALGRDAGRHLALFEGARALPQRGEWTQAVLQDEQDAGKIQPQCNRQNAQVAEEGFPQPVQGGRRGHLYLELAVVPSADGQGAALAWRRHAGPQHEPAGCVQGDVFVDGLQPVAAGVGPGDVADVGAFHPQAENLFNVGVVADHGPFGNCG